MKKYQLNTKLKVLIIVFYTLILFGLILLVFNQTKKDRFESYSYMPYDENLALSVRSIENRKSKFYTGNKNELGAHEKSIFDLQVAIVKLQSRAVVENIRVYVSAQTVDNGYKYKEYSSSTLSMSEYSYQTTKSFSSFSSKEFNEVTKDTVTEDFLFNEEPTKFFVKVTYNLKGSEEINTLTYQTSVLELKEKDFEGFEKRNVSKENDANDGYIDVKNDPVRIKLLKEETEEKSEKGNVKEDAIKVQFNVLKANLNNFKLDDDKLQASTLKAIELPSTTGSNGEWDVDPEINEIKCEVFAKIKSTDDNFSEYVKVYAIYGFMSRYRDFSIASIKFDESFEVEDIYVVIEGKLYNATTDKFEISFKCNYSELESE